MRALPEVEGLRPCADLRGADRDEMFGLLGRHFEGVTRAQFERDLAEKNWVVEIRREGALAGFSTLLVTEAVFEGQACTAIYSGDTIVSPEAWNSTALPRQWIAAVNALRAAAPPRPCYWLLLTSGFRTYRFLPVFWREFYPRYEAPAPAPTQRRLDFLAARRYGPDYEAARGIVRFPHPQRLRGGLQEIPPGRMTNPHVRFFLDRNPGHDRGEELACLTEIATENLTPAGRRMIAGGAPA